VFLFFLQSCSLLQFELSSVGVVVNAVNASWASSSGARSFPVVQVDFALLRRLSKLQLVLALLLLLVILLLVLLGLLVILRLVLLLLRLLVTLLLVVLRKLLLLLLRLLLKPHLLLLLVLLRLLLKPHLLLLLDPLQVLLMVDLLLLLHHVQCLFTLYFSIQLLLHYKKFLSRSILFGKHRSLTSRDDLRLLGLVHLCLKFRNSLTDRIALEQIISSL
jgi:hypothetical protein